MKDISNLTTYLSGYEGLEPLIIVTFNNTKYAKKLITGYTINPHLIGVSNLSLSKSHKTFGQIESTSIIIRDTAGTLRNLIETTVIEGLSCTIDLAYEGITVGNEVTIFKGYISGPIIWVESERSIRFDVISSPPDVLIGTRIDPTVAPFSSLTTMLNDSKDQTIPFVLGCVENAPTVKLTGQNEALVAKRFIFYHSDYEQSSDTTIDLKSARDDVDIFNGQTPSGVSFIEIDGLVLGVTYSKRVDEAGNDDTDGVYYRYTISDYYAAKYYLTTYPIATVARVEDDPDYDNYRVLWIDRAGVNLVGNFVAIASDGAYTISQFNKCVKQEGTKCYFEDEWTRTYSRTINGESYTDRMGYCIQSLGELEYISSYKPGNGYESYLDSLQEGDEVRIFEAGVRVRAWTQSNAYGFQPEIYLVNQSTTNITSVKAMLSRTGRLTEIPYSADADLTYYTIVSNWESSGYTALSFKVPLSEYPQEGWSEEVYVSQRSNTGVATIDGTDDNANAAWGNSAQIVKYLLDTYATGFTTDSTTFTAVTSLVANYPMGLCITEQSELFELIGELAWQSRCSVSLSGTVFKIKYLSQAPVDPTDVVLTINDSLVLTDEEGKSTIKLGLTDKQDLVTYISYKFQRSLDRGARSVTISNNTTLAPNNRRDIDLYAYHDSVSAAKTAGFWLERYSNIWKRFTVTLPIEALTLELYDIVKIDLTGVIGGHTLITGDSVLGEVYSLGYNIEEQIVTVTIEIPVKIGETTTHAAYWAITEAVTLPKNFASKNQKAYNPIAFYYYVEPHTYESHKNINRFSRRDTDENTVPESGTNIDNGLKDKDVLSWDATTKEWRPTSPDYLVNESGGTTQNITQNVVNYTGTIIIAGLVE